VLRGPAVNAAGPLLFSVPAQKYGLCPDGGPDRRAMNQLFAT